MTTGLGERLYFDERNFVTVIRGLLPASRLVAVRETILEAERAVRDRALPSQNERAEIQGVLPDAIRVDTRWYDMWREADRTALAAAAGRFDQMVFPPQIRHMRQARHEVPWHQDIAYQKSLGARGHRRLLTCFVPLNDEPRRHPTLEFAHAPVAGPVDHVDGGVFHNVMPDTAFAETRVFDLELGDVLLFGDLIPHRTFVQPGQAPSRVSMEFRLTALEYCVPGKDYFDLTTQRFYQSEAA
jgi:hypothetical protein